MFQNFLNFTILHDKKVETVKIELLKRHDFVIYPIFKQFSQNNLKSTISKQEFKNILNSLFEFYPTEDELNLFLHRIGDGKECLNINNFTKMFTPVSKDHRDTLNKNSNYGVDWILSDETILLMADLIKQVLLNESKIELFRIKLNKMSYFNLKSIFEYISSDKNYISFDDMEKFMENLPKEEIEILMGRFNKEGNSKTSYKEVI
jgi:hypothetical protein